ncbi:MAG: dihydroorotase [Bacteroides sp.]|nr:dihydroorotase [Bacteroides sp.]MCM1448402.1 dihydroorotase [Bacteroides sp.]
MKTLISNATIVNNGESRVGSLLISGDRIESVVYGSELLHGDGCQVVDANGAYLLPGVIDDHVHFREPGMTSKADMHTESMAAAAGGVTSVLDMPNVIPQTTTVDRWRERMQMAHGRMHVNYGFFIGATNDNMDEILAMPADEYPGVKLFMGSSTGNMLVDRREMLEQLFARAPKLIMAHCEDTSRINANMERARELYGDDPSMVHHPEIRDAEACLRSSSLAAELAHATGARLHIAHISTEAELALLGGNVTGEVCVAHLLYTDADYERLQGRIKCNPSVKTACDRDALRKALTDGRIACIGTDHAPHLLAEKQGGARTAVSGMPMVQFSLVSMLEMVDDGVLSIERLVQLMCHNPATLFGIRERGFIEEGMKADFVLVRRSEIPYTITSGHVLSKCGWSPREGDALHWHVAGTWVNGNLVWDGKNVNDKVCGEALAFS